LGYNYGSMGNYITWLITDYETISRIYTVYPNGTGTSGIYRTTLGVWNPFNVFIDGLMPGLYNFTIYADDGSHMNGSDTVLITVNQYSSDH